MSVIHSSLSTLPSESFTLYGGCDCTSIRYHISVPALPSRPLQHEKDADGGEVRHPQIFFDHCNKCRRVSGAIIQAWFTCPQEWVEWFVVSDGQAVSRDESPQRTRLPTKDVIECTVDFSPVINYRSSPKVTRSFCGRCGTNLSYVHAGRDDENPVPQIDIVLGSLDTESLEMQGLRPDRHFYWESGVGWVKSVIAEGDSVLGGKRLARHPDGNRSELV